MIIQYLPAFASHCGQSGERVGQTNSWRVLDRVGFSWQDLRLKAISDLLELI